MQDPRSRIQDLEKPQDPKRSVATALIVDVPGCVLKAPASAGLQPAIQQTGSLRYSKGPARAVVDGLHRGSLEVLPQIAVCQNNTRGAYWRSFWTAAVFCRFGDSVAITRPHVSCIAKRLCSANEPIGRQLHLVFGSFLDLGSWILDLPPR